MASKRDEYMLPLRWGVRGMREYRSEGKEKEKGRETAKERQKEKEKERDGIRCEIAPAKRETRGASPRRSDCEEEGEENRVPREEVMLKDQSELNSSRVPRRHSTKIPTPCESSSKLERRP